MAITGNGNTFLFLSFKIVLALPHAECNPRRRNSVGTVTQTGPKGHQHPCPHSDAPRGVVCGLVYGVVWCAKGAVTKWQWPGCLAYG